MKAAQQPKAGKGGAQPPKAKPAKPATSDNTATLADAAKQSIDSLDSIMTDTVLQALLPITWNFQPQYQMQQRDGKLMSLEYTLIEPPNRAKAYFQYAIELMDFYQENKDRLTDSMLAGLRNSLKWFELSLTRYSLRQEMDVYVRLYIYAVLTRIQEDAALKAATSPQRKLLTEYLMETQEALQHTDFLYTLLQDVIRWVDTETNRSVQAGMTFFQSTQSSLLLQKYQNLPCIFPSTFVERKLQRVFRAFETRAEAYTTMLRRSWIIATLISKQSVEEAELLTIPKLSYLLRFLCKQIQDCPPSPGLLPATQLEMGKLLALKLPKELLDQCKDVLIALEGAKKKIQVDNIWGLPHVPFRHAKKLCPALTALRSVGALTSCGIPPPDPAIAEEEMERVLQNGNVNVHYFSDKWLPGDVGAFLDNIWLHVDPIAHRLLFKSQPLSAEVVREAQVSKIAGGLFFLPTELIFCEPKPSLYPRPDGSPDWKFSNGAVVQYDQIRSYRMMPVYAEKQKTVTQPHQQNELGGPSLVPTAGGGGGGGGGGILGTSMMNIARRGLLKKKTKRNALTFALSIQLKGRHAREEYPVIISFYPLLRTDLAEVVKMMIYYTKQKPVDEEERIKEVLASRLDLTRQEVIMQLLAQDHPWIDHYNDLKSVVLNLTSTAKPLSLYEMERLYHSCRRERDVAKETFEILRSIWSNNSADVVRLRVLNILERLIDPAVMQADDPIFRSIYNWLTQLEETLNAYRSQDAVRLVLGLIERMAALRADPLPQLSRGLAAKFDKWDDFQLYQQEYRTYSTFFLWNVDEKDVLQWTGENFQEAIAAKEQDSPSTNA